MQQNSFLAGPIPLMIILFLIFYFILIRPQQKKQVEHEKMIKGLKKNDEVVTSGGMHGVIVNVKDDSVILKIAEDVKIELQKSSIAFLKKSAASE